MPLLSLLALLGFAASEVPRSLRIDYFAILQAIKNILTGYSELSGTRVEIEPDFIFAAEMTPVVMLYLDKRNAPRNIQRLAAGRTTDFYVEISIWCAEYHPDSIESATNRRDDLIALVELALMTDHSLQGKALTSWIEGGDFVSGKTQMGFIAQGEIRLIAHARALL